MDITFDTFSEKGITILHGKEGGQNFIRLRAVVFLSFFLCFFLSLFLSFFLSFFLSIMHSLVVLENVRYSFYLINSPQTINSRLNINSLIK